jgi:hypothetical protein
MNIQSIKFDREYFNTNQARYWLRMHGYQVIKRVHKTSKYLKYRLQEPNKSIKYKTIKLSDGVKAIIVVNQKGKGILSNIWSFLTKSDRGRFNQKERDIIDKYGNMIIKSISVFRKPLSSGIKTVLNILSLGKFESMRKTLNYDDVFHVGLILIMSDGTQLILEKNQVPSLRPLYREDIEGGTNVNIPINKKITLNELLNGGLKVLGSDYWNYSPTNNCQRFALSILKGSNILSSFAEKFIYQDAAQLISTISSVPRTVIEKLLNFATRTDMLIHGSGKRKRSRLPTPPWCKPRTRRLPTPPWCKPRTRHK